MNRMSARTIAALQDAVEDQAVIGRYLAFVSTIVTERGCRLWTGAVSSKGHGRLWLASYPVELAGHTVVRDVCVIAHRYGYALEYGFGIRGFQVQAQTFLSRGITKIKRETFHGQLME